MRLLDEYKEKLVIDNINLQVPPDMKNGWVGEKNGSKLRLQLYFTNITRFYRDVLDKKDLVQQSVITSQEKPTDILLTVLFSEVYCNNINDELRFH